MRFILFLLLYFISTQTFSQGTILFCERLDASGNAIDSFESLILSPQGQTIQVQYRTEKNVLLPAFVNLEIASLRNYSFQKISEKKVETDAIKDVVTIPYQLKTPGDYRFRIKNGEGKILAEEILSVSVEMTEFSSNRENVDTTQPTETFVQTDVLFSESMSDEYNTEFSFRNTKGKIRLTLQPFDASNPLRILDIWQAVNAEYKHFIRSEQVSFTQSGSSGIYVLTFPEMKDYKVNIHLSDNTLLTSGFVSFK